MDLAKTQPCSNFDWSLSLTFDATERRDLINAVIDKITGRGVRCSKQVFIDRFDGVACKVRSTTGRDPGHKSVKKILNGNSFAGLTVLTHPVVQGHIGR